MAGRSGPLLSWPPPWPSPDSVARDARGSPSGRGAASWGTSASLRDRGVAAETAVRAPQVIRAGDLKLPGVPAGIKGAPVETGRGLVYEIPRATPEIHPRVTSPRIMDPVTTGKYQYPSGYAVYMNKAGQTVNPLTGQVVGNADMYAHIPLP